MLYAIHGFTGSDKSWADILEPTHLQYRSLLLPGHGWSLCPPETTVKSAAELLATKINQDYPIDLVGYSMGGRVALQIALDFPEKVRRLILVSCSPGLKTEEGRAKRAHDDDAMAEILEEDGIGSFVATWENKKVLKPAEPMSHEKEQKLRCQRLDNDPQQLANAIRCLGQGRMEPLWDRLSTLKPETLLVGGKADARYCKILQEMHDVIPNSHLALLDNCGHAVHREKTKHMVEYILDFLIDPSMLAT